MPSHPPVPRSPPRGARVPLWFVLAPPENYRRSSQPIRLGFPFLSFSRCQCLQLPRERSPPGGRPSFLFKGPQSVALPRGPASIPEGPRAGAWAQGGRGRGLTVRLGPGDPESNPQCHVRNPREQGSPMKPSGYSLQNTICSFSPGFPFHWFLFRSAQSLEFRYFSTFKNTEPFPCSYHL